MKFVGGGEFTTKPVFNSTNKCLVVGCGRYIKVFTASNGELVRIIDAHNKEVTEVHPNHLNPSQIISTSVDKTIKIWNVNNGNLLHSWKVNEVIVKSVVPKNSQTKSLGVYVLNERNEIVKFVISKDGIKKVVIKGFPKLFGKGKGKKKMRTEKFLEFAVSKFEECLVAITKKETVMFNLKSSKYEIKSTGPSGTKTKGGVKEKRKVFKKIENTCVCFNDAKMIIGVGTNIGKVFLYNVVGKNEITFHWHAVCINHLFFSNDGLYLFSAGSSGVLLCNHIYHRKEGKRLCFIQEEIESFAICSSSSTNSSSEKYAIITTLNQLVLVQPSKFQYHGGMDNKLFQVNGIVKSSSHKMLLEPVNKNCVLFTGTTTNFLQWYDFKNDAESHRESLFFRSNSFNPHNMNSEISKFSDIRSFELTNIDISNDGKYLVHSEQFTEDGKESVLFNIKVWEKKKNSKGYKTVAVFDSPHGNENVFDLKFSPLRSEKEEVLFASCSGDGSIKVWKQQVGEKLTIFQCFAIFKFKKYVPTCFSFSKDGSLLFAGFNNFLTIWNMEKYFVIFSLQIGKGNIRSVDVLSNEFLLISIPSGLYLFSLEKMKILWNIHANHVRTVVANPFRENEFSVVYSSDKRLSLMSIEKDEFSGEQKLKVNSFLVEMKIQSFVFYEKDTLLLLTQSSELFDVHLPEFLKRKKKKKKKKKVIEKDSAERIEIGEDISFISTELIEVESTEFELFEYKVFKFDPNRGSEHWKSLIDIPSHSLSSPSLIFESFMDAFIIKKENVL